MEIRARSLLGMSQHCLSRCSRWSTACHLHGHAPLAWLILRGQVGEDGTEPWELSPPLHSPCHLKIFLPGTSQNFFVISAHQLERVCVISSSRGCKQNLSSQLSTSISSAARQLPKKADKRWIKLPGAGFLDTVISQEPSSIVLTSLLQLLRPPAAPEPRTFLSPLDTPESC